MIIELIQRHPIWSILAIGIIITFVSTLITKYFTDQEHLKKLKNRQKEIQKELRNNKHDVKIMTELNSEMLKITGMMMKSSFKPIFITFIPFLVLFLWLKGIYHPIMGNKWIWYYLGSSLISSIILRKVLNVA